ncbi:DUF3891 family protein [Flaviaesturariibacter amylovorans]|uniref:DUF3891 family protein n=1 Tax=Flaviaesturariibacter amylovorans TaxID=1084520 RepID=A0ABP8H5Q9_9BACT
MITVYKQEGWQVVTQRAHGLLAAQLAANWNAGERPPRWLETILAIAEHDDAENELDGETLLTPAGGPLHFAMKAFDLAHCQKLAMMSQTKSRYIALLTSVHMQFVYAAFARKDPEASAFLKEQRKLQASWRKELGLSKEEVGRIYSLMEWCDACSLLLCKGDLQPEQRKVEISRGPDGALYYLTQIGESTLTVDPWPFELARFEVRYESRTIEQLEFRSSEEFRSAFLKAKPAETVWVFEKTHAEKGKSRKVAIL